ncbi:phosphoglycolate phosphatase [Methylocaldum marinum]|uniref:Phosphoglycolate phosphatase n=1 Tax=Methylocaldum marinum TaxID=1432792 RepID=A0A250KTY2_9GAMM|nr:phosphoglycolate phosphatase [Methylocaldum marinum]BBA34411.1 phosphoglycolate phosphatase [Methylocaldum marinum]
MLDRTPELIAFDLDGTLVDSSPDLADAVDAMLDRLGLPAAGEPRVKGWIGNGVDMLVKRALTGDTWPWDEPPRFDEALTMFMDLYEANVCNRSCLFPGVGEGLKQLRAAGFRLACVTNKHSRFTRPLLDRLGVLEFMEFVGCGDQFEKHKPDPCPLLKTAEWFAVEPSRSLMVGDSANDVKAARAAGFMVVCVPYGYHGGSGVECLEPDAVVSSLTELPALFRKAV